MGFFKNYFCHIYVKYCIIHSTLRVEISYMVFICLSNTALNIFLYSWVKILLVCAINFIYFFSDYTKVIFNLRIQYLFFLVNKLVLQVSPFSNRKYITVVFLQVYSRLSAHGFRRYFKIDLNDSPHMLFPITSLVYSPTHTE